MQQTIVSSIISRIQNDGLLALERALCEKTGASYCAVTSGSRDALVLALRTAGVKSGSTVVCPALGDPALVHAVLYAGAVPIFADINPNTWLMDSYCLEYVLAKCLRTKQPLPAAVIASNLSGTPCGYPALEAVCRRYGVALIEDMRHSLGGAINERRCGNFGDFSVACLPPEGEVAAVFCQNVDAALQMREHLKHMAQPGAVSAELALQSLGPLEKDTQRRAQAVCEYRRLLEGTRFQQIGTGFHSAHTGLLVLMDDAPAAKEAGARLRERGLSCEEASPLPLHTLARRHGENRVILSNAENIAARLLPLPLHGYLNKKTIAQIAAAVNNKRTEDAGAAELAPAVQAAVS